MTGMQQPQIATTASQATPQPAALHVPSRSVWAFYRMHVLGVLFPIIAGIALYGWRALASMALVIAASAVGFRLWRRVGRRGANIGAAQGLCLGMLLALMLPAHLLSDALPGVEAPWAILVGAGLLLPAIAWALGDASVRSTLVAMLLLAALFGGLLGSGEGPLTAHWVLYRDHAITGDLALAQIHEPAPASPEGWTQVQSPRGIDAMMVRRPATSLLNWAPWAKRPTVSLDDLPPLEDLIIGGHPGPMGAGSVIAVIVGGLFLLYRGLIDFRVPLLTYVAAIAALLTLPLPYALAGASATGQSLLLSSPRSGLAMAVTFANYQVMAGPMLFAMFFLATAPAARPISRRGRVLYALAGGAAMAAAQLYVSVAYGPYIAVLATMLLTPWLNRLFRARPLV